MENIIKLQKWGNSQGIRIPKNFLNNLGINLNDEIILTLKDDEITIKKSEKKESLKALFKNYTGDYRKDFQEFEYFGESVGAEFEW